jgi:ubiquinone/menaquinone biosynthesis C-methylase UbiE
MSVSERFQGANVVDAGQLSPYWGEHAARYVFAKPHVAGQTVLDIACGTGYGIGLLKADAKMVVGVDIDAEALAEANAESGTRAAVLLGDGCRLPFGDATFGAITSFETLEHLHERRAFSAELARVLKPGGTLMLSTPNAIYTQPVNGVPANKFHVHEYEPEELRAELSEFFEIERFLGQSLDERFKVSPFFEGQKRMPRDPATRLRLAGWKAFNKVPFTARERLSQMIWGEPFYPTEMDYNFSEKAAEHAPTLLAVCRKRA